MAPGPAHANTDVAGRPSILSSVDNSISSRLYYLTIVPQRQAGRRCPPWWDQPSSPSQREESSLRNGSGPARETQWMRPLEDKIAVVTGGAGQIGNGVVRALADAGAHVAVVDVNAEGAEELARMLRDEGHRAVALPGDLTEREQCASVVARTVHEFGGIDILVNLAQRFRAFIPFIEVTDDDMLVSWESGVLTTFRMMQLCQPHMVARGGGSIVNFGSGGGTAGTAGMLAYGSAKEGIRLLTKVGAWEWGPMGIRVNTICPFAHTAERWESAHWLTDELLERIPLRRDGDPYRDIGAAVVYLTGPGEFVTGQTLFVDGGSGYFR